jgi:hypothetical protein
MRDASAADFDESNRFVPEDYLAAISDSLDVR